MRYREYRTNHECGQARTYHRVKRCVRIGIQIGKSAGREIILIEAVCQSAQSQIQMIVQRVPGHVFPEDVITDKGQSDASQVHLPPMVNCQVAGAVDARSARVRRVDSTLSDTHALCLLSQRVTTPMESGDSRP
jgi:hypothetical protein